MKGFAHRRRRGNAVKLRRRLLAEPLEERQLLSTIFTVTNTLDDGSAGSLRWAITQVNGDTSDSAASADRIEFNIPQSDLGYSGGVWTIAPTSDLPTVANPVVIDGYTQSGATPGTNLPGQANNAALTIVLSGSKAPAGSNGLELSSAGITLRGLVINGFAADSTGNGGDGIAINSAGTDTVEGDFIGTSASGAQAVPNGGSGILVIGVGNNTIGGTAAGAGNVIAANAQNGVWLYGIGTSHNLVAGNLVGFSADGSTSLGNGADGVLLDAGASHNTIGSSSVQPGRNVIANSDPTDASPATADLEITDYPSMYNLVVGNYIGTDLTGDAVPRTDHPAAILRLGSGTLDNTIGGAFGQQGNVISTNGSTGVSPSVDVDITGNTGLNRFFGNAIGVNAAGTTQLDSGYGILIEDGATGNTIASQGVTSYNVISSVLLDGTASTVQTNTIQGNFIGVDATGKKALPRSFGMVIEHGLGNGIGGANQLDGNVIAGNTALPGVTSVPAALSIVDGSVDNLVQGNFVGTDRTGSVSLGDPGDGILIAGGSTGNGVGLIGANYPNVIAFNARDGIRVEGDSTTGNELTGNRIYGNGKLGIDLVGGNEDAFGVTSNTPGGPHTGPNNLPNYPVLDTPVTTSAATTITGTLNSTPNTNFTIEFFANPTYDPSGHGQGQTYLGYLPNIITDSAGNASFSFETVVLTGQCISATATSAHGSTSEFSQDVPFPAGTPQLSAASDTGVSNSDGITRDNGSPNAPLTFTVDGVSPPNAFVQLYDDTNPASPVALGSPVQASNGTAVITLNNGALPDGTYRFATSTSTTAGGTQSALSATSTVTIQTSLHVTSIDPAGDFYTSMSNGGVITVTLNHWLAGITTDATNGFTAPPFSVMLIPSGPDGAVTQQQTGSFWSGPSGVDSGDLPVPATLAYSANADGTSTLTLTPDQPLSTDIYLIAIAGLIDLAGNPLSDAKGNVGSVFSSFDYRPSPINSTAPSVSAVTADNGAVVIGNDRIPQPDTIGIRFSKPMDTYTINTSTVQLFEQGVAGALPAAVAYSPMTQSAYLTPETMLVPGAVYYVSVSAAVTDDQGFPAPGVPLGNPFATSFTVSGRGAGTGTSPLTVLGTDPANGTAWASLLGYGAVTFSEPIALSSLGRFSAMLIPQSGGVTTGGSGYADVPLNAKVAFNPNTNQLIIVPTGLLPNDVVDLISLHAITATNGDALAGTVYSTFLLNASSPARPAAQVRSEITAAAPVGPAFAFADAGLTQSTPPFRPTRANGFPSGNRRPRRGLHLARLQDRRRVGTKLDDIRKEYVTMKI